MTSSCIYNQASFLPRLQHSSALTHLASRHMLKLNELAVD
jgi:hypothetical protein